MAILQVSEATAAPGSTGTPLVINAPTGLVAGNVLTASVRGGAAAPITVSAEAGWVEIGQLSMTNLTHALWYRVVTASEPSTYTFTFSATASQRAGGITQWSGVDVASVLTGTATENSANTAAPTGLSVTTDMDGAMLLMSIAASGVVTYTPPAGMAEEWVAGRSAFFSQLQATAGATGNKVASLSASSLWATVLAALRPIDLGGAPSVELVTDDAIETSNTPTLAFVGTSTGAEPVTYQVQISTDALFRDEPFLTDNIDYLIAPTGGLHPNGVNQLTWQGEWQVDDRFGQSFTAQGGILDHIAMPISIDEADCDGDALVRVYVHSGIYGVSSAPLAAAEPEDTPTPGWLAESERIHITTAAGPTGWLNFAFTGANRIFLEPGTPYVLIADWQPNAGIYTNTNEYMSDTTPTHAGNGYVDGWSAANNGVRLDFDVVFALFEQADYLDKLSAVDPGFSGTPDILDPFASGQEVSVTVQAGEELLGGWTYFWRVRAMDSEGWGEWSEARSFTVELPPGALVVINQDDQTMLATAQAVATASVLLNQAGDSVQAVGDVVTPEANATVILTQAANTMLATATAPATANVQVTQAGDTVVAVAEVSGEAVVVMAVVVIAQASNTIVAFAGGPGGLPELTTVKATIRGPGSAARITGPRQRVVIRS